LRTILSQVGFKPPEHTNIEIGKRLNWLVQ
jgi:hypothetical protein